MVSPHSSGLGWCSGDWGCLLVFHVHVHVHFIFTCGLLIIQYLRMGI